MYVLITYKYEKNQTKNEGASGHITIQLYIRCLSAANSVVGGRVWQIIKFIQAFMDVLVTYKNEEEPFKNEGARVVTKDLPL